MQVGIDFGTTYTKIAVFRDGQFDMFRFPGPTGKDYIATAVAYQQGPDGSRQLVIGDAAINAMLNQPGVRSAQRFKLFLPVRDPAEQKRRGWVLDYSPDEVARDFFAQLVEKDAYSLGRTLGKLQRAVVSVPEVWQRTANNPGAEALRRILVDELQLPVDHLRSEPVCAAAFYVWEYRRIERRPSNRPFHLLVCDMGGGTFDVALCQVEGSRIDVLYFDGCSEEGWGLGGARFDRDLVATVYRATERREATEEELLELIAAFEEVKAHNHGQAIRELTRWMVSGVDVRDPHIVDTPLRFYTFRRRYTPTLGQLWSCFQPIASAIGEVLNRVRRWAEENRKPIDRVAIVGGFGQFPLVEQKVLKALGINDPEQDVRYDRRLHRGFNQHFAIAKGAALIAAGELEPVEYYPHTLGLWVDVYTPSGWTKEFLPIVEAGKVPTGMARPQFTSHPVEIQVRETRPLPVGIRLLGTNEPDLISLPPERYPPPGRYRVGVRIDRSNLGTLVFESIDRSGERHEYRLGDVSLLLLIRPRGLATGMSAG